MHGFQKDRTPKLFSLEETIVVRLGPQMLLEVASIDLLLLSIAQVVGALSFRMVDSTAAPSVSHLLSS